MDKAKKSVYEDTKYSQEEYEQVIKMFPYCEVDKKNPTIVNVPVCKKSCKVCYGRSTVTYAAHNAIDKDARKVGPCPKVRKYLPINLDSIIDDVKAKESEENDNKENN